MCPVSRTVQEMVSGLLEIAPHCGSCTVGAGLCGAVGGKQRALGQPGHQGEVLLRETTSTFSPHTAELVPTSGCLPVSSGTVPATGGCIASPQGLGRAALGSADLSPAGLCASFPVT